MKRQWFWIITNDMGRIFPVLFREKQSALDWLDANGIDSKKPIYPKSVDNDESNYQYPKGYWLNMIFIRD